MSNGSTSRTVLTDFGASLDVRAVYMDNCSVGNHYLMAEYIDLTDCRTVSHSKKDRTSDQTIISNCGKWVFLVMTCPRGSIMIMCSTVAVLTALLIFTRK